VPEGAVKVPLARVKFPDTVMLVEGAVKVPPLSVKLPDTVMLVEGAVKVPPLSAKSPDTVMLEADTDTVPVDWEYEPAKVRFVKLTLVLLETVRLTSETVAPTVTDPEALLIVNVLGLDIPCGLRF
jgi:hypothetical protein